MILQNRWSLLTRSTASVVSGAPVRRSIRGGSRPNCWSRWRERTTPASRTRSSSCVPPTVPGSWTRPSSGGSRKGYSYRSRTSKIVTWFFPLIFGQSNLKRLGSLNQSCLENCIRFMHIHFQHCTIIHLLTGFECIMHFVRPENNVLPWIYLETRFNWVLFHFIIEWLCKCQSLANSAQIYDEIKMRHSCPFSH